MSQWQKLTSLCQQNTSLKEAVNELYITSSFPYKIRSRFAMWIEATDWHTIDIDTKSGRKKVEELYEELSNLIETTIKQLNSSPDFNFEAILDLASSREMMRQNYDINLYKFITELRRCLAEEKSLLVCVADDGELKRKPRRMSCYAKEDLEMKQKLSVIEHDITSAENAVFVVEKEQELFTAKYKKLTENIASLDQKLSTSGSQQQQQQQQHDSSSTSSPSLLTEKKTLEEEREKLAFDNLQRRNQMADMHIALATNLAYILQAIWAEVKKYNFEAKLESVGLAQVKLGTLNILDKLFEQGGHHLYRMIQQVDAALNIYKKVNYTEDKKKKQMEMVLKELMFDYLPMFLQRAFIFEQMTWKDRVLKINNGRSNSFNLCARVLGGKSLGLNFTKPKVKISLLHESEIPTTDAYIPGICDITNGDEKAFIFHHSTNACMVQFLSLQLKDFKRPERSKVGEDICEQKYAFVLFTTINVCNKLFPIKLVSLPFILIHQSTQEVQARGCLMWDAAFSEEMRSSYKYREVVLWSELSQVLSSMFLLATDRQLTEEHLTYLAQLIFKDNTTEDFSFKEISEKQFLKDKLAQRDFTFWKWFVACYNLVVNYIKEEWQNGWIYGFISKEEVKSKLLDEHIPCGTFLLRFSETSIDILSRSDFCGQLTMAVVEMDPVLKCRKLFHVRQYLTTPDFLRYSKTSATSSTAAASGATSKHSLVNILKAFRVADDKNPDIKRPLLRYLWPYMDHTFDQLFGGFNTPKVSEDGYEKTEFVIEILLSSSDPSTSSTIPTSMDLTTGDMDSFSPATNHGNNRASLDTGCLSPLQNLDGGMGCFKRSNKPIATIVPQPTYASNLPSYSSSTDSSPSTTNLDTSTITMEMTTTTTTMVPSPGSQQQPQQNQDEPQQRQLEERTGEQVEQTLGNIGSISLMDTMLENLQDVVINYDNTTSNVNIIGDVNNIVDDAAMHSDDFDQFIANNRVE